LGSLGPERLDLDAQGHVHLEAEGLAGVETEVVAFERARRVGAAKLALGQRS
jgi:hypothetical protein